MCIINNTIGMSKDKIVDKVSDHIIEEMGTLIGQSQLLMDIQIS